MSSDNGIYVLVSPVKNSPEFEYRVSYASSIGNIDYFPVGTPEHAAFEVEYFGASQVFDNKPDAISHAIKIQEDIGYTEYGISIGYTRALPFPQMTQTQASKILKESLG